MEQNYIENNDFKPAPKDHKPWLFLGIGFIVGAAVFFYVGQNYAKPVPIQDPFAGARYGITGKVASADGNILTVEVEGKALGLPTVSYKVYTDGKTMFKKAIYPSGSAGGLNIFELKPTSVVSVNLAEIAVGAEVAVRSKANFGDLKEFTASEIELRIYQ